MTLATDAPEVSAKGYLGEDHSSLKTEAEVDVTLSPSNLKADDGASFEEEDHPDITVETDVDAHLPDAELEDKGEGFIQSHVVTDTIIDGDVEAVEKADENVSPVATQVEFAQEVDSKGNMRKQAETEENRDERENPASVHFLREITSSQASRDADEERELVAIEVKTDAAKSTTALTPKTTRANPVLHVAAKATKTAEGETDSMKRLETDLRDLNLLMKGISSSGRESEE